MPGCRWNGKERILTMFTLEICLTHNSGGDDDGEWKEDVKNFHSFFSVHFRFVWWLDLCGTQFGSRHGKSGVVQQYRVFFSLPLLRFLFLVVDSLSPPIYSQVVRDKEVFTLDFCNSHHKAVTDYSQGLVNLFFTNKGSCDSEGKFRFFFSVSLFILSTTFCCCSVKWIFYVYPRKDFTLIPKWEMG